MIVDEDPTARSISKTVLRQHGYETIMVVCPEDALDVYAAERPDAVIVEWAFRSGGGVGLTRRIRGCAVEHKCDVVIVVFSVLDQPDWFQSSEAFDAYFVKPTSLAEIAERIRMLLASALKFSE